MTTIRENFSNSTTERTEMPKYLQTIFSTKPWLCISGLRFNLLFALFLLAAYNLPFARKLWSISPSVSFVAGGLFCAFTLLCAAVSLLFNRYTAKPLAIFFCILNALVFYFMSAYNTPIDKIMLLNVVQTDIYEVQDLLGLKLLTFLVLLGILPALIILKIRIDYGNLKRGLLSAAAVIAASVALCAAVMLGNYTTTEQFFRNHRDAKYYLIPVNYVSASLSVWKMRRKSDHPFVTIADDAKLNRYWNNGKKNLFVLVVGETARAANFSLGGYARPTNAPLDKHRREIVYYGDTAACGTSTAVAVPCMFSRSGRQNFKVGSEEYTENLLDVLQKAGYKVLWRENNTGCKNNCDRVEIEDFCTKKSCLDEIMLTNFSAKVRQTGKDILVVMHQTGSHGPAYFEHYPAEAARWSPVCKTENLSRCSAEELVNVYDNTVYYTSMFLSKVMDELTALSGEYNVALLYASDHGESLGENGIYLHAQPYETAPAYQKEIPMLVWLPDSSARAFGINRNCLNKAAGQPHSHDNLFHSVLGLAGIETIDYEPALDIFSGCRKQ